MTDPLYSICMINLNMVGTIKQAVTSVARQLNDNFEIIIVDGGSTDGSIEIIEDLIEEFPIIRLHKLSRDSRRLIGADRNTSVDLARGKYVLLNIDCDDIYGSFILDWVYAFHLIEKKIGKDILVSGMHINMLKKELFKSLGGYKNIRFEDRDLWMRCATLGIWVFWKHVDFVTRMGRSPSQRAYKLLLENYHGLMSDHRQGLGGWECLSLLLRTLFRKPGLHSAVRVLLSLPAFVHSRFCSALNHDHRFDPVSFSSYRKLHHITLCEIVGIPSAEIAAGFQNQEAQGIFLTDQS